MGRAEGRRFRVEIFLLLVFLVLAAVVGYGFYSLHDPDDISYARYWQNCLEINILHRTEGGENVYNVVLGSGILCVALV